MESQLITDIESLETATAPRPEPRFLVTQLGARMHYAVPRILWRAGILEHFYSDICAVKGWPRCLGMIPAGVRPAGLRRLLGRIPRGIPNERMTLFTSLGCRYAWQLAHSRSPAGTTKAQLWASRAFARRVANRNWGTASAVYTFNGAGLETLEQARRRGLRTIVEQTIAPLEIRWRLLREEERTFPTWLSMTGNNPYIASLTARQHAEWDAADLIVCGSEFVRTWIAKCGGPSDRCKVVPYGVDIPPAPEYRPKRRPGRLRVLTVGSVDLRKGAPYVLGAAKKLREAVQFRMVGPLAAGPGAEAKLRRWVELVGPVPRAEVAAQYRWADVFLLPSLCEGSATAVYEALGAGLPVICTPNTGSVVRDEIDGFVVPIRDIDAIVDRLDLLASRSALREEMSTCARQRAAEFTLARYARRLIGAITTS